MSSLAKKRCVKDIVFGRITVERKIYVAFAIDMFFQEIFGAFMLFNNFISLCSSLSFSLFAHDTVIVVWGTLEFSLSPCRDKMLALWAREQFTIFAEIFYTKTADDEVTSRINIRRKWRCSEIFRWSPVSQLGEIPSVVQSFLFSRLFHLLFPLAYFYFLQKSNGFCHGAISCPSLFALHNATRLFCVYSCFLQLRFFSFLKRTGLAFSLIITLSWKTTEKYD